MISPCLFLGDVMGGAADSLANLVRLPTGCGEQNLVNLAPSVFILRYLKITQRFAPTLTEKAVKYIKKGILPNQLIIKSINN